MDGKMIEAGEMQVTIHLVALDHVEARLSPNNCFSSDGLHYIQY